MAQWLRKRLARLTKHDFACICLGLCIIFLGMPIRASGYDLLFSGNRYNREQMLASTEVMPGIPKNLFGTGVLYGVGPSYRKTVADNASGRQKPVPLKVAAWRQTFFELDRNKLYRDVLPSYEGLIESASEYRWVHAADNRQPFLVCDVEFEWFTEAQQQVLQDALQHNRKFNGQDGFPGNLKPQRGRFFGVSLLQNTLHSHLITFAFEQGFIISNRNDPLERLILSLDGKDHTLSMNDTAVIDLGQTEGKRQLHVQAEHLSGATSKALVEIMVQRLPTGEWSNTVERDGRASFAMPELPVTIFFKPR